MKYKRPRIAKTILKKIKVGGLIVPNFKTYYKAIVIKMLWYWFKVRHIDQQNTTENSEINLYSYGQLIFDKGCQDSGEKSLRQITLGQLDTHLQKSEVRALYHSYTKIKLIKYLHTGAKTIKLLEKNTGVNLHDFGLGNSFLNMTTKAQVTKQNKNRYVGLHRN